MGKYFGTDGFRGEANKVLNANHAYTVGRFLGWYYSRYENGNLAHKAKILIGKDTRRSSYMFEYAISAGIIASGADAYIMHVTTTPSVSYITRLDDFSCGVMISASHNPFCDNGIKLVNSAGEKMDDETIEKIEAYIDGDFEKAGCGNCDIPYATGEDIGKVVDYVSGRNRYIGYLISIASNSYRGLKIGLDCANGSSWMIAKSVFDALGAKTYVINASPDGVNINRDAGSTHMEGLQKFVVENGLDVGFAYDGDADRCLAVDEHGNVVCGDEILYIFAKRLKRENVLDGGKIVTTVMSNIGLYKALDEEGIGYEKTQVGDRYVYENMAKNGYKLGGEQSGHIILYKYATTGDGILTSIMLTEEMIDSKLSLSKLASPVTIYPQVTKNIVVSDKDAVLGDSDIKEKVGEIEKILGNDGRILLRKSGTEPVIRVMVESSSVKSCENYANDVIDIIRKKNY